jgi:hypothetical protein
LARSRLPRPAACSDRISNYTRQPTGASLVILAINLRTSAGLRERPRALRAGPLAGADVDTLVEHTGRQARRLHCLHRSWNLLGRSHENADLVRPDTIGRKRAQPGADRQFPDRDLRPQVKFR